jgi:hypothetical protein
MKQKFKAVYAPGELEQVRINLGPIDDEEARRMTGVLGGQIGWERTRAEEEARSVKRAAARRSADRRSVDRRTVDRRAAGRGAAAPGKPEAAFISEGGEKGRTQGDDNSIPAVQRYKERVRMDTLAAEPEFNIKTTLQLLLSMVSVFKAPSDYVNPEFINVTMSKIYRQLELLVSSTRSLLPRNNAQRSERFRKASPFYYAIIDVIRHWNIEKIASSMAKMQTLGNKVMAADFADVLKAFYRPLYCLEKLPVDPHIQNAYKLLYKVLYVETGGASGDYKSQVQNALSAYSYIQQEGRCLLYPLLMKLISDKFYSYNSFFFEKRGRIALFLNVKEQDQIVFVPAKIEAETAKEEAKREAEEKAARAEEEKKAAALVENKALVKGQNTLELIFPKAGWNDLASYPDLYPYFHDVFHFKKGCEMIDPGDPIQQTMVLMRIIEELCYGLRFVEFTGITGKGEDSLQNGETLNRIVNDWGEHFERAFEKEYLSRLTEYCRILDTNVESRTSPYAMRIFSELHWIKRLYFLPFYKIKAGIPPSIQKRDVTAIYPEVRKFRRCLTNVAAGIEGGLREGGAAENAYCSGIANPWAPYTFEVPNPVSERLDAVLGKNPKRRNNAGLVFFALSAAVILDHLMNDEDSWAYAPEESFLFRSVNNKGVVPQMWVDIFVDTQVIFKEALKERAGK